MINPHLPQPAHLRCNQIRIERDAVTIMVETMTPSGSCPCCGQPSGRLHSRYTRLLADLPWQGRLVRWCLLARKFFCDTPACPRRIFTERLAGVAGVYSRNTARLNETLVCVAFSCGGEGGARLATRLGMPTSADTLLRRIRNAPSSRFTTPRVLGVDDWAKRKGQRYGTILCDLEQHRPVDVLDDRKAETLAAWLRTHPEVEVITRDRARFYARGASCGAPQAMQVADRFHLMQNLRQALIRMLERRHRHVVGAARDVAETRPEDSSAPSVRGPPKQAQEHRLPNRPPLREVRRCRRLERYQKVMELHQHGSSQRKIAKQLGINRGTVGRYVHMGGFPERAPRKYASMVDPFTNYLRKRWEEGCHNAAQLTREMMGQGFTGSFCTVRRHVAHWDRAVVSESAGKPSSKPPVVHPPSVNRLAWLLLKEPETLDDDGRIFTEALFRRCPELNNAGTLAREFGTMARERRGDALDAWIQRASDQSVPRELRVFATGLRSDYQAVKAAFTTDYSNAQVEGQVNRLKLIKRQMYGRAKFDLLRKRVLHAG